MVLRTEMSNCRNNPIENFIGTHRFFIINVFLRMPINFVGFKNVPDISFTIITLQQQKYFQELEIGQYQFEYVKGKIHCAPKYGRINGYIVEKLESISRTGVSEGQSQNAHGTWIVESICALNAFMHPCQIYFVHTPLLVLLMHTANFNERFANSRRFSFSRPSSTIEKRLL